MFSLILINVCSYYSLCASFENKIPFWEDVSLLQMQDSFFSGELRGFPCFECFLIGCHMSSVVSACFLLKWASASGWWGASSAQCRAVALPLWVSWPSGCRIGCPLDAYLGRCSRHGRRWGGEEVSFQLMAGTFLEFGCCFLCSKDSWQSSDMSLSKPH